MKVRLTSGKVGVGRWKASARLAPEHLRCASIVSHALRRNTLADRLHALQYATTASNALSPHPARCAERRHLSLSQQWLTFLLAFRLFAAAASRAWTHAAALKLQHTALDPAPSLLTPDRLSANSLKLASRLVSRFTLHGLDPAHSQDAARRAFTPRPGDLVRRDSLLIPFLAHFSLHSRGPFASLEGFQVCRPCLTSIYADTRLPFPSCSAASNRDA